MLFGLFALASSGGGADTISASHLLVGSYTQGKSKGIYLYRFDESAGHIFPMPLVVAKAENPSWLTLSTDQRYVYAVDENGPGQRDVVGRVTCFGIDRSGRLRQISQVKSLGDEPTYASLSIDGKYLFVANYSVHADPGSTLAIIPVGKAGVLQPVTQIKTQRASQVDPERQMSPHIHSAVSSPDGRFLFTPDLGADKVYVYRYDPIANAEQPLTAAPVVPFIELPPGSGPRNLVFSKDGKHAYLTLEMAGSIVVFDYGDGQLHQVQMLAMAPEGVKGTEGGGAIHLSPDGRLLYATNRGSFNELLAYRVDPASGRLTPTARRSTEGREPREFTFDATGRYLLVANQFSNTIVVIARDPETGHLGKVVQSFAFDSPSYLQFLKD